MRLKLLLWWSAILLVLAGCGTDSPREQSSLIDDAKSGKESEPTGTVAALPVSPSRVSSSSPIPDPQPPIPAYAYTHQRADGNRVVDGRGSFPDAPSVDIQLDGLPTWVVAAPQADGALWVAALADGRIQAFQVTEDGASPVSIEPAQIGQLPPVIKIVEGEGTMLVPTGNHADFSPPVEIADQEIVAFIQDDGNLKLVDMGGNELVQLETNALLDGRLLVDEQERILFLSGPTTRYDHGVLGDETEASSITLVETEFDPEIVLEITIDQDDVVEGIMPLWADLSGDGRREIIVTQSNAENGARIVVYNEDGSIIGQGPSIGQGYRWRHQLTAGPFGPDGETELVDVLTPHIGGVVEFYQLIGDDLVIVASVRGFTSHVIGTRNLDMAVAGDFDGDGHFELLLPDQSRNELGGIRRTDNGAEVAWRVPVGGRVVTNLAAVELNDGRLSVGVGRQDGTLRIWLP
jgi:hypothetical protein